MSAILNSNEATFLEGSLTSPEIIDYVYRSLLGRPAEPNALTLKTNIIEFIIGVANSDERSRYVNNILRKDCIYDIVETDDGHMIIDTRDKVIGNSLKHSKTFTEKDVDKTIHLLNSAGYSVNKSLFLDVGANIGTHTIHALKGGFQNALCIEPDYENYKLLLINQVLNNVSDRCQNICAAASISDGRSILEKSPINFGDHRVVSGIPHIDNIHREENWCNEKIKTFRLDNIFDDLNIDNVGIAWIDTQGHEGHVLQGARRLMLASTPVVIEFWPYGLSRSGGWPLLREALQSSARSIYELRNSIELNSLHAISVDDLELLYNVFLVNEKEDSSPHTDLLLI